MKLGIDLQACQTESRFRGIGRYSLSLTKALIKSKKDNEIFIILNGSLEDTVTDIRSELSSLLPDSHFLTWHTPQPIEKNFLSNEFRWKTAEYVREAFILSLNLDMLWVASPMESASQKCVSSAKLFDLTTPLCATVYDFIPFLNRNKYLIPESLNEKHYMRSLQFLSSYDLLFGISDSSCKEAISCVDTDPKKIVNIGSASSDHFYSKSQFSNDELLLLEKFGIDESFIFYSSAMDERKNHKRLIQAYARLPEELRESHQLVLAGGQLNSHEVVELKKLSQSLKLSEDRVIFTGYISDNFLNVLYNLCVVFIMPSWHEGFGLPALEALNCGCAVIASNTSSLPEILSFEEALFDPFDINSISSLLGKVLTDNTFREKLKQNSFVQAKKFSWEKTASSFWENIISFHNRKDSPGTKKSLSKAEINSIYDSITGPLSSLFEKSNSKDEARLLAHSLYKNEKRVLNFNILSNLPKKLKWRVEGFYDTSYSLALVNREFARGLESIGHEVALDGINEYSGHKPKDPKFFIENTDLAQMFDRRKEISQSRADLTSSYHYPPTVDCISSSINMVHTYGWEETAFPKNWIKSFNEHLSLMTTMSNFVKKVMIDNGLRVPISSSGLGVDHWLKVESQHYQLGNVKSFKFLHVSSCFPRKGVEKLLESYGASFDSGDDVSLIIKTFRNPHNQIHEWLKKARQNNSNYPHIVIIEDDLDSGQLKSLYEQSDVLVAPSKGEGFGLPLAEALLTGLPVITTAWGGQMDFCNSENSWLIDYDFKRAETHFNLFDSVWAEPSLDSLSQALVKAFKSTKDQRKKMSALGRDLLLKKFKWKDVAVANERALRRLGEDKNSQEPKVGWVSTWGEKCGIAMYSEHLLNKFSLQYKVFASRLSQQKKSSLTKDPDWVNRSWDAVDTESLVNLENELTINNIDIVVIQFQYGFFEFSALSDLIEKLHVKKKKIIMVMHSTTDINEKRLVDIKDSLSLCTRILVHTPRDMNRLKAVGCVENVSLIPLGVLKQKRCYLNPDKPSKNFRITTYGFFLPHKGIEELVKAVSILLDKGLDIKLDLVNAEYPNPISRIAIEKVRSTISKLKIEDAVSLETNFLSDEECFSRISNSDLVVYPYQTTGESSSAAVRFGLSSGVPIAVTPLDIFEDIKGCAFELPGCSPGELAKGLMKIIDNVNSSTPDAKKIKEKAEDWVNQHDYTKISEQLGNMFIALNNLD